ncbi:MAG: MFS transporter [Burkholderiaceae bacterium]|nr:MFS transporter [Burkholderiaceae bacterium]
MRLPNLLATSRGRLTAFFFLYVTEGIPLGFAAIAVATQLRRQDVGPAAIGAFVGSFYLPWAFKWAFGPFIDVFASERLGRRRGWIIVTQVLMAMTLLSTVLLKLPEQLALFTAVLLVHNTFGAMQDVAIDALAVNTLAEHERGLANGLMFAGAAIGQALGGSGVLFLSGVTGFQPTFFFVAGSILAVTLFVALPMREATPTARARAEGPSRWQVASAQMRHFAVEAFRSFLGTRGAFVGLAFALLPSGAMCLGLALQSNLAVELGLDDDQVALLNLWSSVISAGFMVLGGHLSDRYGRRRTLAVYIAAMSLPVLYLMALLQQYGWVMPVPQGGANPVVAPSALVLALWIATLAYAVAQGLMYGTRSAIFMDVTNPAVAATQFTAYMALLNLGIAYSATWQGIAIEAIGYPKTMLIDALFGLVCLLLLPWLRAVRGNMPDGGAPRRARASAAVLGLACIAWLPYRLHSGALGAAAPIFETVFTVVFVASALFLLAGGAVLERAPRAWVRAATWMALLLLALYARRWMDLLSPPLADGAALAVLVLPPAAGVLLLALAAQGWRELAAVDTQPAAAARAGAVAQ